MLTLFPVQYWLALAILSLIRLVFYQIINWYLYKIISYGKNFQELIKFTSIKWFMLIGGVGHICVLYGIIAMFFITFVYVVPVTPDSHYYLIIIHVLSILVMFIQGASAIVTSVAAFRTFLFYNNLIK